MRRKKLSNAQLIYKQDKSTGELRKELTASLKVAKEKMRKLKEKGLSKSEFYQEHKKDFENVNLKSNNRLNLSKELARVNQFLNSKSSTPKGLKQAEKNLIEVINEKYGDMLNEKNVRDFQRFMKMYRDKYEEQVKLDSDKVVDAFKEAERLKISKKDMLENIEAFIENEEELQDMDLEDMFEDGKIDKRRRFKLEDYLS